MEHFKFKEKSAPIELWWKLPRGVKELIPAQALLSNPSRHAWHLLPRLP